MKQRTAIAVKQAAKVKYAALVFGLILAKVITCIIFNLAELRPPPAAVQITVMHFLRLFLKMTKPPNKLVGFALMYHILD